MEEAERLSDDIQMIADRIESIYRRKDTLVGSQSKGEDDGTMKEVEDIVHLLKSHPFLQSSQPQGSFISAMPLFVRTNCCRTRCVTILAWEGASCPTGGHRGSGASFGSGCMHPLLFSLYHVSNNRSSFVPTMWMPGTVWLITTGKEGISSMPGNASSVLFPM